MAQHEDADAGNDAWTWAALEPEPTDREKALLDLFAQEYVACRDRTKAASRCGFQAGFAEEYGKRFYTRAYVQKKIKQLEDAPLDPKQEARDDAVLVKAQLRAILNDPYAKHSARVSAARELASLHGMHAPVKTQNTNIHKGGVLVVPAVASIDDWEAAATASQGKLMEDSRVH